MEVFIEGYGGDPKTNPDSLIKKIHRSAAQGRYIELHAVRSATHDCNDGTRIYFWSAAHPAYNRVRGFTHPFHLIVGDESSYVRANAITKVSLKMLADCGGKFLAIGTPDVEGVGFGWFSTFWGRAMSDSDEWADWTGMTFPSEANPTITLENIAKMRSECMSKEEEAQEIDALFLEDTSGVFGNLKAVFTEEYFVFPPRWMTESSSRSGVLDGRYRSWVAQERVHGVHYVIGADWARKLDRTVFTVFRCDTRREVCRVEMKGEEWDAQMSFLIELRKHYGDCSIHSDATGVGDGMTRILQSRYGESVVAHTWGGYTKERLVRTLHLLFSTKQIRLINAVDSREQFRLYIGERNERTGRVRYSSPDGEHDDHVDATLLVAETLLVPTRSSEDPDSAEIEPEAPPPGTMASLRQSMDEEDWVSQIAEAQI